MNFEKQLKVPVNHLNKFVSKYATRRTERRYYCNEIDSEDSIWNIAISENL